MPKTLNPQLSTLNSQPSTLNFNPSTFTNPKPLQLTLNPKLETRNPVLCRIARCRSRCGEEGEREVYLQSRCCVTLGLGVQGLGQGSGGSWALLMMIACDCCGQGEFVGDFARHQIDGPLLFRLSRTDLRKLGIVAVGTRLRLGRLYVCVWVRGGM